MRGTTAVRRVGALALAGTLALTACGVSGSEEPAAVTTTTLASSTTTAGTPAESTTTTEAGVQAETTTTTETATTTTGGGTDGSAKADFIDRANQICRTGIDDLAGREPSTTDEAAMTAYITDVFVPSVRQQIDDIRALGLPPGDEAELTAIFDATDTALDRLAADPIGVINSGQDPFAAVNDQLNRYGLTDCGGT